MQDFVHQPYFDLGVSGNAFHLAPAQALQLYRSNPVKRATCTATGSRTPHHNPGWWLQGLGARANCHPRRVLLDFGLSSLLATAAGVDDCKKVKETLELGTPKTT